MKRGEQLNKMLVFVFVLIPTVLFAAGAPKYMNDSYLSRYDMELLSQYADYAGKVPYAMGAIEAAYRIRLRYECNKEPLDVAQKIIEQKKSFRYFITLHAGSETNIAEKAVNIVRQIPTKELCSSD